MSKSAIISWVIGVLGLGGGGFAGVRAFIAKLEKEVDLVIREINTIQAELNQVLNQVTPSAPAKKATPAKAVVKKAVTKRK
jgi:hypothetical protein